MRFWAMPQSFGDDTAQQSEGGIGQAGATKPVPGIKNT
eukprot:CAMPEP_0180621310 /NCGR_PEP_ID=MMETSP1037_2-20121125/35071_1 /TAXON_ID=632150 /ORGANISM="Azadinium spinosum, Strain 3D9" /LENGTH=37 /DNA_ID= /DNA_START= /DNA_END= /DNA_ORIENTATION=